MLAADVVGVLLGDLLGCHPPMSLNSINGRFGAPVPEHRGVVLLLDVGLRIDKDAYRHVAVDLEPEDRPRAPRTSGVSANLTPPAFIRPPVRTCDLITVGPPIRWAASRASVAVVEAVLGDRDPGPLDDPA